MMVSSIGNLGRFGRRSGELGFGLFLFAVCSCGGDTASQRTAACNDYAKAFCDKYTKCQPAAFDREFGRNEICMRQMERSCTQTFLPGSGDSPEFTGKCASLLAATDCPSWIAGDAACMLPAGAFADGSSCQSSAQCSSRRCSQMDQTSCGVCMATSGVGQPCGDLDPCQEGLVCNNQEGKTGSCVALFEPGQPCDATSYCKVGSMCSSAGICERVKGVGEPCILTDECDSDLGLRCSVRGVCQVTRLAGPGDDCFSESVICIGYTYCDSSRLLCVTYKLLGERCDSTNGPYCEWGLDCVDGKCAVSTPPICASP
jgi:hypothetical protein